MRRAIDSVLPQLDQHVELLVIDDGSSDDTLERLRAIDTPNDKRAGYMTQANAGPAVARNRALDYCNGTWVLFLDADDQLVPNAIELVMEKLSKEPTTDLLLAGHIAQFVDGKEKYHAPSKLPASARQRVIDYLITKRISVSHGCSVFRKSAVLDSPYAEELRQGEDIPVFAAMLECDVVRTLDAPLAVISKHPGSLRNDVDLTIANSHKIADIVFKRISLEPERYKPIYMAKRNLSAFRTCCKADRQREAIAYYKSALRLAPSQALRWTYLKKLVKIWLA